MDTELEALRRKLDAYEQAEAGLRLVKAELTAECNEYGRRNGVPFFTLEHLRKHLLMVGAR